MSLIKPVLYGAIGLSTILLPTYLGYRKTSLDELKVKYNNIVSEYEYYKKDKNKEMNELKTK